MIFCENSKNSSERFLLVNVRDIEADEVTWEREGLQPSHATEKKGREVKLTVVLSVHLARRDLHEVDGGFTERSSDEADGQL